MTPYAKKRCANPSAFYTCAQDVTADENLTESEKEYILKSMAFEVDVLIDDDQEFTAHGEKPANIDDIHKALDQLSESASLDKDSTGDFAGARAGKRGFSSIIAALSGDAQLDGKVIEMADRVAETCNGGVIIVSVVQPDTSVAYVGAMSPIAGVVAPPPVTSKSMETRVDERLHAVRKTISKVATKVDEYTLDIRHGEIAEEVLRASNDFEADLIIIGKDDRNWLEGLLSPETAQQVAKGSVCPVLIVPE